MKIKNLTGPKIRFYRKQRNWTQQGLANALRGTSTGISRQIIANIETQRCTVTDCEIAGIAKVLRIPIVLFFRDDMSHDISDAREFQPPVKIIKIPPFPNQFARGGFGLLRRLFRRVKPLRRKSSKKVVSRFSWWKKCF